MPPSAAFTLGGEFEVRRLGYGAMRITELALSAADLQTLEKLG